MNNPMRKTAGSVVFFSMIALYIKMPDFGRPDASRIGPPPTDEVRIVASLDQAVGDSLRPTVLMFFSLDCLVCWEELFEVRYLIEKNSISINLVGISADSIGDLEPFLAKHAFFYPVVSDPGRELFRRFNVRLEPRVLVLDGGRVIYRDNAAEAMDARREKLKRCLLEISAEPPS